jgi:tRNA-dihydrouridine synthase A
VTTSRRGPLHPLSIAPMMKVTDRTHRAFMRGMTRHTLLYTEMLTTGALIQGGLGMFLATYDDEHPIAIQLGGDDPGALAECAVMAADAGFDEVDLNVGCPSPKVVKGNFGASLMLEPKKVADAVAAMRAAVELPVTVKHRIGVDHLDRYEDMARFVEIVAAAGCDRFVVHARKALLSGLNPHENRTIPPLRYRDVYRLKADFPHLAVEINGGIRYIQSAREQLEHVDGVMIGRAAEDDPFVFARADSTIYGAEDPVRTRRDAAEAFLPFIEDRLDSGESLYNLVRPMLNLFAGQRGARAWRRALSEDTRHDRVGVKPIVRALDRIRPRSV